MVISQDTGCEEVIVEAQEQKIYYCWACREVMLPMADHACSYKKCSNSPNIQKGISERGGEL